MAARDTRLPHPANEMTPRTLRFPRLHGRVPALALVLALVASVSGAARGAEGVLYEAEVPWADRGPAARSDAFRHALRQVLVKLTGQRQIADTAALDPLVENAPALVQQYRLDTVTVGRGDAMVREPRLWARFDETAVDRLVREAGLPVWGSPRPSVLAWVAAPGEETFRMAGAEGADEIAQILLDVATSRGVPLVLPLLDLEDRALAGPSELWVEAEDRIRAASERYRPGGILIGRIDAGVLWEARWVLLLPGAAHRFSTEGYVFELVVDEGMQEAVDALAAHYLNIDPAVGGAAIVVSVSGVHDFEGYLRTTRYLESLDEVESVEVLAVVSGRLRLGLKLRTGVAGLRGLLALGATLAEDSR